MMKLGEYVIVLLTMMVVLEFVGVPTGLSTTLNNYGIYINPATSELISADLGASGFWDYLLGNSGVLLLLLGAGAIIVGFFAKGYDVSLAILPIITTTAFLFISTFWSVISYVQQLNELWMTSLIATIFIGLGAGFIWSCIDYFAGR